VIRNDDACAIYHGHTNNEVHVDQALIVVSSLPLALHCCSQRRFDSAIIVCCFNMQRMRCVCGRADSIRATFERSRSDHLQFHFMTLIISGPARLATSIQRRVCCDASR